MKEYITPEMEVTRFETEDIITTSGQQFGGDENGGKIIIDP